jgi:hypothetical protein
MPLVNLLSLRRHRHPGRLKGSPDAAPPCSQQREQHLAALNERIQHLKLLSRQLRLDWAEEDTPANP